MLILPSCVHFSRKNFFSALYTPLYDFVGWFILLQSYSPSMWMFLSGRICSNTVWKKHLIIVQHILKTLDGNRKEQYFHVIEELNCIFIYPVLRGIELIGFITNDSIQSGTLFLYCTQLFVVITWLGSKFWRSINWCDQFSVWFLQRNRLATCFLHCFFCFSCVCYYQPSHLRLCWSSMGQQSKF